METPKPMAAGKRMYVSGGGAYKYCELIESKLNLTVVKVRHVSTNPRYLGVIQMKVYKCTLKLKSIFIHIWKVDEMDCICAGSNFLIRNIADETFTYDRMQSPPYTFQKLQVR